MTELTSDQVGRLARLEPPTEDVSLVLDTDAYNEVDDQFAIAHALRSSHEVEAIYAAPFDNDRSEGPADGMEQSYEEIERVLDLLAESRPVYRGATRYMRDSADPVDSDAVRDLIERAHAERDGPLYVVAIGAATNVASAIATDPEITGQIVVVWLGGTPHDWHAATEFNLSQDVPAARVLFDSGVPLVHVPTVNVAEHVRTTVPELRELVEGRGAIGSFLVQRVADYPGAGNPAWSKAIWDLAATAVPVTPDAVETALVHSPVLTSEQTWSHDPDRHFVRVVRRVDRDAVFADFVERLGDGAPRR